MIIEPDVASVSRSFAGSSVNFPRILEAMCKAEGPDPDAIVRAARCSTPVKDRTEALEIAARSLTHAMADFISKNCLEMFIVQFGATWAPVGATNDPTGLNKNWPINVLKGLRP
jgi:hypothetical protein